MHEPLSGFVRPAVEGLEVEVSAIGGRGNTGHSYTSSDGRFDFGYLEPGQYQIKVMTPSGSLLRVELVNLSSGTPPVEVHIPQAKIQRPVSGLVSVKALTKDRGMAMKLIQQATALNAKGQVAASIERLQRAAERDPQFALTHHELAARYCQEKRLFEARNELLKAIEIDPRMIVAYTNLGLVDIGLGNVEGALAVAERAVELDRANVKARAIVQFALRWLGRPAAGNQQPSPSR